jgi:G3E family GTPase
MTQTSEERVPVTLLAGFLGSGKTTLANRILTEQHDQRIAVIVNEFGDVGIDGRLVIGVDDNVIELSNGCLCCTVRGDLADTLHALLIRRRQSEGAEPFERILIEASGLASPGPVAQALLVDAVLSAQLQLDGIVTMVHAQHITRQLQEHPEASEQVGYADHLILNHCDQCTPSDLDAAEAMLRACNPYAAFVRTTRAQVNVLALLQTRTWESINARRLRQSQATPATSDAGHDHHTAHDHADHDHVGPHTCDVSTLTLRAETPLDLNRLKMWLLFVSKRKSHELMRLKGILHCQGHAEATIIQGVYQWLEVRHGVERPPDESVLVLIGRYLDAAELRREWEECCATL